MKSFDCEFAQGMVYVWRDDGDPNCEESIVLDPVVTHHQKPDSGADNPDDYYGYIDWHFEVWEKTDGWKDEDTREAIAYAAGFIDEKELV